QAAIPFLALAAGAGWERLWSRGPRWLAAAALLLALPYGLERAWTLLSDRTAAEIEAARFIRSLPRQPKMLALEQTWAYGEHLYLGNDVDYREIELARPLRPRAIREAASGADIAGVYARHLDEAGRRELEDMGFRPIAHFKKERSYDCLLFGRGPFSGLTGPSWRASEMPKRVEPPTPPVATASPAPQKR
ncbi:MAG TPA: hypothetical protein VEO37_00185, partial [Thermoanaerobaculia bacterium]|nr:hypothetical protein [Thermoanaerobaculia bacterium]